MPHHMACLRVTWQGHLGICSYILRSRPCSCSLHPPGGLALADRPRQGGFERHYRSAGHSLDLAWNSQAFGMACAAQGSLGVECVTGRVPSAHTLKSLSRDLVSQCRLLLLTLRTLGEALLQSAHRWKSLYFGRRSLRCATAAEVRSSLVDSERNNQKHFVTHRVCCAASLQLQALRGADSKTLSTRHYFQHKRLPAVSALK